MCTVAISNSPVFSPSRVSSSLFCKSQICSSPEKSPSSSSPAPFKLRLQKPPSGLIRTACNEEGSCSNLSSSSPTLLKRKKRPGRLDIPVAALSFSGGGDLATEERRKEAVEVVEDEGYGYSVYCKRGRREAMEDRYKAVVNLHGDVKQAFFGVFDGHGGPQAAEFASENIAKNILDELNKRGKDEIEEAVKEGYLQTDVDFLKQEMRGGSCCATALIKDGKLIVSNAGDCRAVISRSGTAVALTSDHRPSREDEKQRIESLGGYVDNHRGVWRILGSLAVSRGIGDRSLKQWVTAEPETNVVNMGLELEFLIIGSDGLWEKVSNQEAVDIARPLCVGLEKPETLAVCKKLVQLSVSRGSVDDVSVMIIQLGRFC